MEKTSFGERLKKAFGNAKQVEIARKMGVSESAVKNYVAGRVPDAEKLLLIKNLTNCNLHWLLTGEGDDLYTTGWGGIPIDEETDLYKLLYIVANEQGPIVFADAEIGAKLQIKTTDLLMEYLLNVALLSFNLITKPLMSVSDWKRAQKFTFVADKAPSLDDQMREIVERILTGKSVSSVAQTDDIRDMIREIIREEIEPKRPLVKHDFKQGQETTQRKAG